MPPADVTLVVPGLLGPRLDDSEDARGVAEAITQGLALRGIETLLSRAAPGAAPPRDDDSVEGLLFDAFGAAREEGDWPAAAVTLAVDGEVDAAEWVLRADPVYLRADVGEALLFDAGSFGLRPDEAGRLVDEINGYYADEPWRIEAPAPARWYLRLGGPARLATWPLSSVAGGTIKERLPRGEDAARWQAVMNEMQMILHASEVNRDREARREPPVNGVWLWGGGRLPRLPARRFATVWSDDVLTRGLARLSGAAHRERPATGREWLSAVESPGPHLITLLEGARPARLGDAQTWREFLAGASADWLDPLVTAAAAGRIGRITLRAGTRQDYVAGRRRLRQWWRRARPFSRHMVSAARRGPVA